MLRADPSLASELEQFEKIERDSRIELAGAVDDVERWVQMSRDENLGLKAALAFHIGVGGPLDFLLRSASSLRETLDIANTFAWMYSEALSLELIEEGDVATLTLGLSFPHSRAITDFALGVCYRLHLDLLLGTPVSGWFSYERPSDTSMHERVFPGCSLHFGAPFSGFTFARSALDLQLETADPMLHALQFEHLRLISADFDTSSVAVRVRRSVASSLACGAPTANSIAKRLGFSRRTLVRRLIVEGTSYSEIVEQLRRDMADRALRRCTMGMVELSRQLGFSRVQVFYRWFKRWTGMTPMQYRVARTAEFASA